MNIFTGKLDEVVADIMDAVMRHKSATVYCNRDGTVKVRAANRPLNCAHSEIVGTYTPAVRSCQLMEDLHWTGEQLSIYGRERSV